MTASFTQSPDHPILRSPDAVQRGRRLEYLTLAWNSLEAVAAIVAGLIAGSIALVGFGLDSVIECFSGGVLLWRLRAGEEGERREARFGITPQDVRFLKSLKISIDEEK